MSHESYITIDAGDDDECFWVRCSECDWKRKFALEWRGSVSVEQVYAIWLRHLGYQP